MSRLSTDRSLCVSHLGFFRKLKFLLPVALETQVTWFASVLHKRLVIFCATSVPPGRSSPTTGHILHAPVPPHVWGRPSQGISPLDLQMGEPKAQQRMERGCFPQTAQPLVCTGRPGAPSSVTWSLTASFCKGELLGPVGSLGWPAHSWQAAPCCDDCPWPLAPEPSSPSAGKCLPVHRSSSHRGAGG